MKVIAKALLFLFVPVYFYVYPGTLQKGQQQENQERKSLILKELLEPSEKTLPVPKRNIFTRQRGRSAGEEVSPRGDLPITGEGAIGESSPVQKKAAAEKPRTNVQYIGYVQSGKKVVALIILEGQTYAVESGDVLEMGVTIGEITPDDLEMMDQDNQSERIRLEGE